VIVIEHGCRHAALVTVAVDHTAKRQRGVYVQGTHMEVMV
jgi:hypothetical protein